MKNIHLNNQNYTLLTGNMIIGICELYNPNIHGGSNTYMKYKYMVNIEFEPEEFYNGEHIGYSDLMEYTYNNERPSKYINNPDYSDFKKIVTNPKYYNVNILEEQMLETGEMVCIVKTLYISLLQRKWRKKYKEYQHIISKRKNPKALIYRAVNGKWPKECAKYV